MAEKAKYFIGSDFDQPLEMFFDIKTAFASCHWYIDSFDEEGKKVCSYRLIEETEKYTDDF